MDWRQEFRDVLQGTGDQQREGRALIKRDATSALRALNVYKANGLTTRGAADGLDEVVGVIDDPMEAREAIEGVLSDARIQELLAARGDLASSAALVVSLRHFVGAMLRDISDLRGTDLTASIMIYLWSLKARDRDDYEEFLAFQLDERTVEYWLLAYLVATSISGNELLVRFDELNLNEQRSLEFIEDHKLRSVEIDLDELEAARASVSAHQEQRLKAETFEEEVRQVDQEVADELEF